MPDASFVNTKMGEVAAEVGFKAKGSHRGSLTNLMGDAFREDFTPNFIEFHNK